MKNLKPMLALIVMMGAATASGQEAVDLEGIWKMVYKKWELSDTVIERTEYEFPSYKIFFKDHFSLSRVDEEGEFVGHFGDFKIEGEHYSELIKFSSYEYLIGRTVHFKSAMDGNTWTISGDIGTEDLKFELVEIWERME